MELGELTICWKPLQSSKQHRVEKPTAQNRPYFGQPLCEPARRRTVKLKRLKIEEPLESSGSYAATGPCVLSNGGPHNGGFGFPCEPRSKGTLNKADVPTVKQSRLVKWGTPTMVFLRAPRSSCPETRVTFPLNARLELGPQQQKYLVCQDSGKQRDPKKAKEQGS